MPFFIYETSTVGETRKFQRLRAGVQLAGAYGPIATHAQRVISKDREAPQGWHLSEDQLLNHWRCARGKHALVIDLKPKKDGLVSLYQLRDVWGFSYPSWTPIALRLETLCEDKETTDPLVVKEQFCVRAEPGDLRHEFLYLRGGTAEGGWGWGPVGSVNGALLSEAAWNFFVDAINGRGNGKP